MQRLQISGLDRQFLWKAPSTDNWTNGAILVLHGGGGKDSDFCSGGVLVQPQIDFASLAIENGFAVFLLNSTQDVVTDAEQRLCGKRFDFPVLARANIDLPYIEEILLNFIPQNRPQDSNTSIFMTGLSTGGYMTIRASTHFDALITAFAPISAGDPYGTNMICDPALSPRSSAVGILTDRETDLAITEDGACLSADYPQEDTWETMNPAVYPTFKQFHHKKDGIVDFSCAEKINFLLKDRGYPAAPDFHLDSGGNKDPLLHLWLNAYNQPLVDFFVEQAD